MSYFYCSMGLAAWWGVSYWLRGVRVRHSGKQHLMW